MFLYVLHVVPLERTGEVKTLSNDVIQSRIALLEGSQSVLEDNEGFLLIRIKRKDGIKCGRSQRDELREELLRYDVVQLVDPRSGRA